MNNELWPLWRTDSGARSIALEWAIITFLGLLYITLFMPLAADTSFTGVEYERLSGVLLTAEVGLKDYDHIPTWNPTIGTGEPFLNNPFNNLYNPFASLPVLIFGGVTGGKIAIGLGLLIAGYGAWALAWALGIGTVARITTGALYMMSGSIAGKFYPGHVQLGLSMGYVPLVLAGLWWTLHSADRRAPAALAVSFALLFFAGNIYFTLHTLVCSLVILLFHLVERRPGWRVRWDRLRRIAVGAAFGLGLTMVLFLPVWAIRDSIQHGLDPGLEHQYGIEQVIQNLTLNGKDWLLQKDDPWPVAVDYAYIGVMALVPIGIAAGLLVLSRRARQNFPFRAAVIALVCAGLMMIWGAGQVGFLQYLYANVPLLAQFRFVGRALGIAALWWIVLSGLAINLLWNMAADMWHTRAAFSRFDRARLLRAAALGTGLWLVYLLVDFANSPSLPSEFAAHLDAYRAGLTYRPDVIPRLGLFILIALVLDTLRLALVFPLWGRAKNEALGLNWRAIGTRILRVGLIAVAATAIIDLMLVNSAIFKTGSRLADFDTLYGYIHQFDETPIPAVLSPNTENFAFDAYYNKLRYWGLNEGWTPVALPGTAMQGELDGEPPWTIALEHDIPALEGKRFLFQQCLNEWTRQEPDAPCPFSAQMTAGLYNLPNALPYAFIAPETALQDTPDRLNRGNVETPSMSLIEHHQDTITVWANAPESSDRLYYLVVQETNFPGWQVFVDGVSTKNVSIGAFIGVPMLTGTHKYILRYQPPGFTTGVVISLATLLALGLYVRRSPHGGA